MLTRTQNERLTRVGRGTPCGNLLRHYWHPVCPSAELTPPHAKKRVRILGEDLLVFRTPDGTFGCVEERCPHRGASLFYGFVENDGIRCCYHGWKYGMDGACIDQPFEKSKSSRLRTGAYPIQELGGLLFVYMGPDPDDAPALPRFDVIARSDRPRKVRILPIHNCNWLQIQENTVDLVHIYYLHGHMSIVLDLPGKERAAEMFCKPIKDYHFDLCPWGITKSMVYEEPEGDRLVHWPPFIFPNLLRTPERNYGYAEDGTILGRVETIHWRVPIDDTHTMVMWIALLPNDAGRPGETTHEYVRDTISPDGEYDLSDFYGQDRAVWETQGAVSDRTEEHLGASDGGIVLFRRMLEEQIARVERGEKPNVGVVGPAERDRIVDFTGRASPAYVHA